jgi:light-regulated signal transduction histidine kinase (bacteriophytochrome)
LEQKIQERTAELNRSNQALEQFASTTSHDLQAPLHTVIGYIQRLKSNQEQLDEQGRDSLQIAAKAAERMQVLIREVLAYSRINGEHPSSWPTDSGDSLQNALDNLAADIASSGVKIERGVLPIVDIDKTQITQLFQNLIQNAIKFRGQNDPTIRIGVRRSGGDWLFSVSDNGIGMEPKHSDKIFNLFHRLHGQDQYPGHGIGLAVCKKIVERHCGKIWVESQLNIGTTFYFTLPGCAEHVAMPAA